MKFLLLLVVIGFVAAAEILEKDNEYGTGFPESWYETEGEAEGEGEGKGEGEGEAANSEEDDGLSAIPNFMDADADFAPYFANEVVGDAKNILQVAKENGATVFVHAAMLSGLKDELSNCQNITAFIPSNRAFRRLPKALVIYFLRHKDRLAALLKYHVIHGTFAVKDLVDDATHVTLLHNLTIRYDTYTHASSNYTTKVVQGSHVNCKRTDLIASNGIVHIVDDVILRFSIRDSYYIISKCSYFSTFYNGLVVAGLIDDLKSGSLTVFAPTEKAFKRLPAGLWEKILANKQELTDVLDFHLVEKTYFARGFRNDDVLDTLNKANTLTVTIRHDRRVEEGLGRRHKKHHRGQFEVEVNNAKIEYFDGVTTTGVIQVIDKVLLPPKLMAKYGLDEELDME